MYFLKLTIPISPNSPSPPKKNGFIQVKTAFKMWCLLSSSLTADLILVDVDCKYYQNFNWKHRVKKKRKYRQFTSLLHLKEQKHIIEEKMNKNNLTSRHFSLLLCS
ncbi:hypothetical protein PanWU01x14_332000 [Parasponia andersonii]|uniref:Uncharacterized protein n=1 Tax=Parasponia andersonii TaxID=3476 RepID=A0A2P5AHJ6_PARAD|nr:hypothetical protein PanWU01x14_332000 [Parasponia andersonii]